MNRCPLWQAVSLAFAVAGIGVAGYLTLAHYRQQILVCGIGDCYTVQNSPYAEIAGVPIALLGLSMYVALAVVGLVRWRQPTWQGPLTVGAFAVAFAGTVYAAYLTYLELWVIQAICQWCVVSAGLTLGLLIAEGYGVSRWLAQELHAGGSTS